MAASGEPQQRPTIYCCPRARGRTRRFAGSQEQAPWWASTLEGCWEKVAAHRQSEAAAAGWTATRGMGGAAPHSVLDCFDLLFPGDLLLGKVINLDAVLGTEALYFLAGASGLHGQHLQVLAASQAWLHRPATSRRARPPGRGCHSSSSASSALSQRLSIGVIMILLSSKMA